MPPGNGSKNMKSMYVHLVNNSKKIPVARVKRFYSEKNVYKCYEFPLTRAENMYMVGNPLYEKPSVMFPDIFMSSKWAGHVALG